ncbi:uncharacterized protein BKA78DRAFT_319823 [Phyllosticta capitalensis]|uniref:uncharacterized protein n=1 Tax=Phyllosticta capitalensis TaxID=121624 RepID=UPI00312D7B98
MWHTKGNSVHENNPEQSTHTGTDPTAIQCAAGRPAEVGYDVDRSTATWDIPCIFMQQAPKLQASGRMEIFILQFCRPRLLPLGTNAMNGRKYAFFLFIWFLLFPPAVYVNWILGPSWRWLIGGSKTFLISIGPFNSDTSTRTDVMFPHSASCSKASITFIATRGHWMASQSDVWS